MGVVESLFQKITNDIPHSVVALQDGFNNASYLINDEKVFRLKKMSDAPFYNAKNEGRILELISPNRISPKVYYFDFSTGNMIDRFINGNHRFANPDITKSDLRALASLLRRLHSVKNCHSEFYASQRYSAYKLRSGISGTSEEEKTVREKAENLIRSEPLVLCHNDLVHDNILRNSETGQLVLIDFEFAGLNNAMFDLASLLSENEILDKARWEILLRAYFGKNYSADKLKKLILFMQYENYLWFYWAETRAKETKYPGFKGIADMKKKEIAFFHDYYAKNPNDIEF